MVFSNNLLMGAGGQASGYDIEQSIRFNDNDSAYLARTPTASNRKTWTFSCWVKRASLFNGSVPQIILSAGDGSSNDFIMQFGQTDDKLRISDYEGSTQSNLITTQVFRDVGAWYHFVLAYDTTQSTAANRIKLYVNGSQVTDFGTETYPTQNNDLVINSNIAHNIGRGAYSSNGYFDGYIAEIHFIDGTALTQSSFGVTNSDGIWVPKAYSGSYGTNGFFIDGRDSSDLGDDESGNGNDFSSSGLAAADSVIDSPTNNLPTFNALSSGAGTLSDGNLQYVGTSGWTNTRLNLLVPDTGKWALRFKTASSYDQIMVGLCAPDSATTYGDLDTNGVAQLRYNTKDGNFVTRVGGSLVVDTGPPTTSAQTFFQLLFDMDNGKMGMAADDATSGTFADISTYSVMDLNGSSLSTARQPFALVYSGTDANAGAILDAGQSGWETTVTGFKNLISANLSDPTIFDPSKQVQATLYTGNGSTQSIDQDGNSSFQPDWVWIKNRDAADNHVLTDAVRGATKILASNSSAAEATDTDTLTGFESNGFALGDDVKVNTNTEDYVAWQWKANGSGSSNTDGDLTATVSANATSGFSIIKYQGTGSATTVGHGLGVAPKMVIVKDLDNSRSFNVYHDSLSAATKVLYLDQNVTEATDSAIFGSAPTSSIVNIATANGSNGSGIDYIMYAFAEIEGFSAFGSFSGNANADGPFVYLGFSPAIVILKNNGQAYNWQIRDNKRDPFNVNQHSLSPSVSDAEAPTSDKLDFLSNGFKIRDTGATNNGSGDSIIYAAWAESPFRKTANAL